MRAASGVLTGLCLAGFAAAAQAQQACSDVAWQADTPGIRLAQIKSPNVKVNFIAD